MKFKSRPELYLYTMYLLKEMSAEEPKPHPTLLEAISRLKKALNQHEQDTHCVIEIVDTLSHTPDSGLKDVELDILKEVKLGVQTSYFDQTAKEKWENPLGTRLESALQIAIAMEPGKEMMTAVHKLSLGICDALEHCHTNIPHQLKTFLDELTEEAHPIGFGAFKEKEYQGAWTPTLKQVTDILKRNEPKDFIRIICIHFKFGRTLARQLGNWNDFCSDEIRDIADTRMYQSSFYKDRGRLGSLRAVWSQSMGIMTGDNVPENASLPMYANIWVPDSKGQAPDLRQAFTLGLIEKDTPYVAGVSGMTSIMVAQFLVLAKNATQEEKQLYIAAIAAYIVSGGLHCLHEVLAPIAYCLKPEQLLPGYAVMNHREMGHASFIKSMPAPDYDYFYQLLLSLDPTLEKVLQKAWGEMHPFFKQEYLPQQHHLPDYAELAKKIKPPVKDDADEDTDDDEYFDAVCEQVDSKNKTEVGEAMPLQYNDTILSKKNTQPKRKVMEAIHEDEEEGEKVQMEDDAVAIVQRKLIPIQSLVLATIDEFQGNVYEPRLFQGSSDSDEMKNKLSSLKNMLRDASEDIIIKSIILAIFKSPVSESLKDQIVQKIGFDGDRENALMFLDRGIQTDCQNLAVSSSDVSLILGVTQFIQTIANISDTVRYEDMNHRGDYEKELTRLESMVAKAQSQSYQKR